MSQKCSPTADQRTAISASTMQGAASGPRHVVNGSDLVPVTSVVLTNCVNPLTPTVAIWVQL